MNKRILVCGTGYIGISTLLYFKKAGFEVVGIDLDQNKIDKINKGEMPQKDLESWLDFNPKPLLEEITVYDSYDILNIDNNFDAIFIAIPTEKNGEPWFEPLRNTVSQIKNSINKGTLVIIESTLTPGVAEKEINPYIKNYAIAPRRDWFTDKDKTLETLSRIVGGKSYINTNQACKIISYVCKNIHMCTAEEAQLVKACENTIRHMGAVFAQQLALAYPSLDTRKILQLASTKWNIPYYFPNFCGTSGYCIPVSSKYVKYGAENPEFLTILDEVLMTDKHIVETIKGILQTYDAKKVAILGMSYLGDIKVHVLSGCKRILESMKNESVEISIHDTLYSEEEIKEVTGKESFKFPDDLDKFDAVIVASDHTEYKNIDRNVLIEKTKDCKLIFDNCAIWEDVEFKVPYKVPGRKSWIK